VEQLYPLLILIHLLIPTQNGPVMDNAVTNQSEPSLAQFVHHIIGLSVMFGKDEL
jgi:hypothetical protein